MPSEKVKEFTKYIVKKCLKAAICFAVAGICVTTIGCFLFWNSWIEILGIFLAVVGACLAAGALAIKSYSDKITEMENAE